MHARTHTRTNTTTHTIQRQTRVSITLGYPLVCTPFRVPLCTDFMCTHTRRHGIYLLEEPGRVQSKKQAYFTSDHKVGVLISGHFQK